MNWLCSRELVAEYSVACCSDGALSAPSNSTHTPQAFSLHGKMTGFSRLSRYGMMCEPLTEECGEALLTWFRAAFPAKTYPQQEKEPELMENDPVCGGKWQESLARYDRASSSWKTHRSLWEEALLESLVILPKSGLMRDGVVYRPESAERRTYGIDSGYWPTPTASCYKGWSKNHNRANTDDRLDYTIERKAFQYGKAGRLNPEWVEWLMG
jgi:hypothetical protein